MSMTENDYRHFVCIVAGENPDKLMEEYNRNKEIEPKIIYKYSDIARIKEAYIKEYEKLLKKDTLEKGYVNIITDIIEDLKSMSEEEYYEELLNSYPDYYPDEETGNIMVKKNIDGKFSHYNIGKSLSMPFITNDGEEIFQTNKGNINWDAIHLSNSNIYELVWEMVMEGKSPTNEEESVLYNNMKDNVEYFKKFENKENYIISNTAFWGYAFLSEKTGWIEINDNDDQFMWMRNFYDVFIKNLSDNTILTIYECIK